MRLLHVSSSYPLETGGNTAPFMEEMLGALADRGHDVRILVPRVSGLHEGLRRGVQVDGVAHAPPPLQRWGYGRSLTSTGRVHLSAALVTPVAVSTMAIALRRTIARWRPDVVHLHWLVPLGVLGLIVPRQIPVVVSAHGADAGLAIGALRPIAARALRRADQVIAASSPILNSLTPLGDGGVPKVRVIPHGAEDRLFGSLTREGARERLGLAPDEKMIFAVGRLVPKKGFATLIEAAESPKLADTSIFIGGSGPDELRLRRAMAPGSSVTLLGQLSRTQVAEWLAAADVVAVPSSPSQGDVDSGPVVLMEALASGTPVVSTGVGMAPDVIRQGHNGGLVSPDDPEALAGELAVVLAASAAMGREALRTFQALGSWKRVAAQLEDLYRELLNDK